jgi:hypothetical protein
LHRLLNWSDKGDAGDKKDENDKNGDAANGKNGDGDGNGGDDEDDDEDGMLNSDRPDFTEGSAVIGRKRLQIESGYTYTQAIGGDRGHNSHDFPELEIRYGLAERLELRLYWEGGVFDSLRDPSTGRVFRENGATDMDVGFKYALTKQDHWIPETAFISLVSAPIGSRGQSANQIDVELSYAYSWQINKKWNLAGTTGNRNTSESNDHYAKMSQSIDLTYQLSKKIAVFNEWYVLLMQRADDSRPQHYYDAGILYHVAKPVQLDWRAGTGLNAAADGFFTGCGITILR